MQGLWCTAKTSPLQANSLHWLSRLRPIAKKRPLILVCGLAHRQLAPAEQAA